MLNNILKMKLKEIKNITCRRELSHASVDALQMN